MKTIKDIWEHYEPVLAPCDVPPIVRRETRRAFYTGAHAALSRVMALGKDSLDDEAAAAGLAALCKELGMFFADVMVQRHDVMSDEAILADARRWRFVATRLSRLIITSAQPIGDRIEIDIIDERVNFPPCTKESADAAIDRLIQRTEGVNDERREGH